MKAFCSRFTGKWKWGKRGLAIHDTKEDAEKHGIYLMTTRLKEVLQLVKDQEDEEKKKQN